MAKRRSRLLVAALASALAASGCVIATQAGESGGLAGGRTVTTGLKGTNQSTSAVRGDVKLPASHVSAYRVSAITNAKAAVGASVTLRDYKLDQAPNAPTVKTDGNGKFTLSKVPPDHIWVVTADHKKGLAASLVFVESKKVANVSLTLGSTLAVAAIQPLFFPDASTKDAVSLDSVDLALFQKLVDALDAALTNDTLIPAEETTKAYRKHFAGLKTGAVLEAYNKLVDDLKKKGSVNTKPPAGEEGTGPDPDASEAEQPEASSATGATEPAADAYKPRSGVMSQVSGVKFTTAGPIQMGTMAASGFTVMVVPDDTKVYAFLSATAAPSTYTGADLGLTGELKELKGIASVGSKAYMVGSLAGKRSLLILEPSSADPTKLSATAKELVGEPIANLAGLVYSSEKSALIGVDEGRDVLVTIAEKTASAEVALYAGSPDITDSDPPGADNVDTILFNQPSGIAKKGAKIYVTDTLKHRIVEIDVTTDKAKAIAGVPSTFALTNGPLQYARFHKPRGIAPAADGGFFIADTNSEALRYMNVTGDKVISLIAPDVAGSDKTSGYKTIPYPRGVAEFNGKVFAVDNMGNLWTWTKSN